MILAENNVVFPNSDSKITINTYKIRLGQKLRMLPATILLGVVQRTLCLFKFQMAEQENLNIAEIKKRSLKAIKWSALAEVSSRLFPPAVMLLLARILTPSDFGIVGVASIAIGFASIVKDFGLSKTLIQTNEKHEDYANNAFWMSIIIGVVTYLLIFTFSPLIAMCFKSPESSNVLRVLCLIIVINSMFGIHYAVLQRRINFKTIFIIRLISSVFPGFISIPMALMGMGVWSLVYGMLAGSVSQLILAWMYSEWKPKLSFNFSILKDMVVFSKWIFGEGIMAWVINWGDSIAIGYFLGVDKLGIYRIGMSIISLLSIATLAHLIPITFSLFSRLQSDMIELKNIFYKLNYMINAIVIPMGLGIALISNPLVRILFGTKWTGVEVVIAVLAIRWVVGWTFGLLSTVYTSVGKPDINLKLLLVSALVSIPIYLFSAPYGIAIFCLMRLVILLPEGVLNIFIAKRCIELSVGRWVKSIIMPIIAATIMSIIIYINMNLINVISITSLLFVIFSGVLSYLVTIWFIDKQFCVWSYGHIKNAI